MKRYETPELQNRDDVVPTEAELDEVAFRLGRRLDRLTRQEVREADAAADARASERNGQ